jgi:hypothetical protein
MFLTRRSFSALSLGACLAPGMARAQNQAGGLAIVELFTSQGCSSCPPADALMVKLAGEHGILPLTLPVEIWDYLGWKDTLAKPTFTRRQKAYAAQVAGKRVYTPQAIVNGSTHCVGSDFSAITRLRRISTSRLGAKLAILANGDDWRLRGELPVTLDITARLVALPFRARETVQIGRGENSGRTITYANVVRDILDLGALNGGPFETRLARAQAMTDRADGVAVMIQAGTLELPGAVLAAVAIDPGGIRA